MIQRDKIKDWTGKIIGFIETDSVTGNKVVKDFHGRLVAKGDQSSMLLAMKK